MSAPGAWPAGLLLAAVLAAGAGCGPSLLEKRAEELRAARARIEALTSEKQDLQKLLAAEQKKAEELSQTVVRLRGFGQDRLVRLTHVERIELGRHTGAVDSGGAGGHDAIKVFLLPIDQHGSTIKAAGEVKIRLFDLAAEGDRQLLGEHTWGVDDLPRQWSSGFLTYHYSFVCRWERPPPPTHDKVTVHVEFDDYLTGRRFTADETYPVALPPRTPPATRPATRPATSPAGR